MCSWLLCCLLPRPRYLQRQHPAGWHLRLNWALLAALLAGLLLSLDNSLAQHWSWVVLYGIAYWEIAHWWLQRRLPTAGIGEMTIANSQPRLFGRSTLTLADGRRLYCDYRTARTPPASVRLAQAHNRYGSWYWRVDALGNRIG